MAATFERALKQGHTVASAAEVIGVSPRTVSAWIRRGDPSANDDPEPIYREFFDAALRGRSALVSDLLESALNHAVQNPTMCLELLKIHHPDFNVAKKVESKHEDVTERPDYSRLSVEEKRLMRQLELKSMGRLPASTEKED